MPDNGLYTITEDGKAQLHLHPGQTRVQDSTARFTLMLAGSQGGKTIYGPWWLVEQIEKYGGGDYLAVTANYDLFRLKMLPALKEVFCEVLGWGRYWAGDKVIEICNLEGDKEFWAERSDDQMWARIILRSAHAPRGLESATANAAWLDEAGMHTFTVDVWQAVLRRLSLSQGPVLLTTTPYELNWLKTEFYDRWEDGDPDYNVVQFASILNPQFPRAEYERAQRTMPDWKFRMFYQGLLTRPPGQIFHDFDRNLHVCEPFPVPDHWERYVGVDPGGVNTATVWIVENPETQRLYLFRESLEGNKTTREHVETFNAYAEKENIRIVAGGAPSEGQFRRDWADVGRPVSEPLISDVESGIDKMIALVKSGRFQIFSDCVGILDEIATYSRVLDKNGEPTDAIRDKNKYHRIDAARYLCPYLDAVTSFSDFLSADAVGEDPFEIMRAGIDTGQRWWNGEFSS